MICQEIHQPNGGAEEIPVAVTLLGRYVEEFLFGSLIILFINLIQVPAHGTVHPQAQFWQEGIQIILHQRIVLIPDVVDGLRIEARIAQ